MKRNHELNYFFNNSRLFARRQRGCSPKWVAAIFRRGRPDDDDDPPPCPANAAIPPIFGSDWLANSGETASYQLRLAA